MGVMMRNRGSICSDLRGATHGPEVGGVVGGLTHRKLPASLGQDRSRTDRSVRWRETKAEQELEARRAG